MDEPQLAFPFELDKEDLTTFLAQWCAIEDEQDRLRAELRLLKERYVESFPMRGVLTAIKIVRARRKLATHPKEPMIPVHLSHLETLVAQHMQRIDDATGNIAEGL